MVLKEHKIIHKHPIRVRYADTDMMGYVYNGTYLTYFEVGRSELMRYYGLPYTEFEKAGYLLPLVESHVRYKRPATYDDILYVEATLDYSKVKATLQFDYKILLDDEIIAEGYTIHSFQRASTRIPVKPPVFMIEALNKI